MGVVTGATAGLIHGLFGGFFGPEAPDPVVSNFVDRCLREKGYEAVGWKWHRPPPNRLTVES